MSTLIARATGAKRSAAAWVRTWWLTVPEPRELSLSWGAAYSVLLATGAAAVFGPPHAVIAVYSWPALAAVGWLMIVSAAIGMLGGWREFWQLERIGIAGMAAASLLIGGIAVSLPYASVTMVTLGYIALALVTLAIRYMLIWRFTYRPRG